MSRAFLFAETPLKCLSQWMSSRDQIIALFFFLGNKFRSVLIQLIFFFISNIHFFRQRDHWNSKVRYSRVDYSSITIWVFLEPRGDIFRVRDIKVKFELYFDSNPLNKFNDGNFKSSRVKFKVCYWAYFRAWEFFLGHSISWLWSKFKGAHLLRSIVGSRVCGSFILSQVP